EARDGLRRHVSRGRQNARVVFADDDRVLYVFHIDVAEDQIADVVAAVAVGLDADAIVRALKMDALGDDVVRAAGDFAADGEAVAMQEGAVGDGDVAGRIIAARGVDGAGFDGDVVVAHVGVEMIDAHVGRGERIHGIGVWRAGRRQDADIAYEHIVAVVGNKLPER